MASDIHVPITRKTWPERVKACRGIGAYSFSFQVKAAWAKEPISYMKALPKILNISCYATVLDLQVTARCVTIRSRVR